MFFWHPVQSCKNLLDYACEHPPYQKILDVTTSPTKDPASSQAEPISDPRHIRPAQRRKLSSRLSALGTSSSLLSFVLLCYLPGFKCSPRDTCVEAAIRIPTTKVANTLRTDVQVDGFPPWNGQYLVDNSYMYLSPLLLRLNSILGEGSSSDFGASYEELMAINDSNGLYDDVYVVHYDFSEIDHEQAIEEFEVLIKDLTSAGLKTSTSPGPGKSLLVLVKSPAKLLGKAVYKSRVKDWLYGVTQQQPESHNGSFRGETETENLRSMFHLVTWSQKLEGAGITPQNGKWKNVKSVYPLHNRAATKEMLLKWSRQLMLRDDDLDDIRGLFGEKVAFYFAFVQTYLIALVFPSVTGILAWLYLPGYPLFYAIITSLWCIVFLEHWKLREVDLSLRWSVRGVGSLKVNRSNFKYDKEVVDPITNEVQQHYSHQKQIGRQLLQVPFALVALVGLGSLISIVFAIEIFISEVYNGPFKFYLEYLPTILLAVSLPFISSFFESVALTLTEYENHRTEDRHEMALTQKIFVLSSITKYSPILLTAFVYVPCGDTVVAWINSVLGLASITTFTVDSSRLRNEVVALVVTEQLLGFGEELILPVLKRKATRWYGERKLRRSNSSFLLDSPSRTSTSAGLPHQARNEAELEKYNVQDDIQQMVLQFGYLALFSPVWPLIPVGFLINNWIELRSDFLKICIEHQRPAPIRADSIGPWLAALNFLNWLGSISTAAIVFLFRSGKEGQRPGYSAENLYALAAIIFLSEHIYLMVRFLVRVVLERIGSDAERRKAREQYIRRKKKMDELQVDADEKADAENSGDEEGESEDDEMSLWTGRDVDGRQSVVVGLNLIKVRIGVAGGEGGIRKED